MSFVEQLIDVSIGTSCGANNGECERIGKIIKASILLVAYFILSDIVSITVITVDE